MHQYKGETTGGEEEEVVDKDDFKTMYHGKPLTPAQLAQQKLEDKKKQENRRRRDRRKAGKEHVKTSKINRHNPYDTADRQLISNNMTKAVRPRPSQGDRPGSSGLDSSAREASARANQDSQDSNNGIPTTLDPQTQLSVYREDKTNLTREDIFIIHTDIETAEIDLMEKEGTNLHDIIAALRQGRGYLLQCNTIEAVNFYQEVLNNSTVDHSGFKTYKDGEKVPGHQITGRLYRTHWKNKDKFHIAFCAGSAGNVKTNQVTQYRNAKFDKTGMIIVYLEIDDDAFEWLRTKNWTSRMGGTQVPWRAPNIEGLSGVYRPDENVQEIKAKMIEEYNNFNDIPVSSDTTTTTPPTTDSLVQHLDTIEIVSNTTTIGTMEERSLLKRTETEADEEMITEDPDRTITETNTETVNRTEPVRYTVEQVTEHSPTNPPSPKSRRSRTTSGNYKVYHSDSEGLDEDKLD